MVSYTLLSYDSDEMIIEVIIKERSGQIAKTSKTYGVCI